MFYVRARERGKTGCLHHEGGWFYPSPRSHCAKGHLVVSYDMTRRRQERRQSSLTPVLV